MLFICLLSLISNTLSHNFNSNSYPVAPQNPTIAPWQHHLVQEPCPPCPAPAPPTVCPKEKECPVVTCTEKTKKEDDIAANEVLEDTEKQFRARVAARRNRRASNRLTEIVDLENKCNNEQLRSIMLKSTTSNIVKAKVTIAERAGRELGGQFNVICTSGIFSYYAIAGLFCEVTRKNVTCFAFRHDPVDSLRQAEADHPSDNSVDIPSRKDQLQEEENLVTRDPDDVILRDSSDVIGKENDVIRVFTQPPNFNVIDPKTQNIREETFTDLILEFTKRAAKAVKI